MNEPSTNDFEISENDIELLVDTLRQCFGAEKARYSINQNSLIVEIAGLQTLSEEEITEVADPVLTELDAGFDEILLLNLD